MNELMPEFSIIYPDSNSLIKEGWPNISTTLGNLFNLTRRMSLRFVLLDPVEQELEAHYLRDFAKSVREVENKAENVTKLMRVLGSKVNLQIPGMDDVQDGIVSISAELDLELRMLVEPGLFSRMQLPKKLKLGGVVVPQAASPLAGTASAFYGGVELREQVLVKTVSVELQATRSAQEYREVTPISMELK